MKATRKHFFSLIELLVVIGIIILLAGITLACKSFAARRADQAKTIAIMTEFETALEAFKSDYGYYPVQKTAGDVDFSQDAWKLFVNTDTNKRNRPYMEGITPTDKLEDAYGNPFQYEYPNSDSSRNITKFALWSKGPNGDKDTKDDICNWKQN